MNPDVALLVYQFKRGAITPQQFSAEMREMNYSVPQIMQIIADVNNPRIREPSIPAPDGTPPVVPASQPTSAATSTPSAPSVPRRENYAIDAPYYGSDDIPVGSAYNAPLQEDRATRARLSDLPSDFGSPTGSMAYPSQLPPNLQPSTVQQAINVAKSIPQREASNTQTTGGGPSALAALIRGRFGEAAQGNPMDDRLTAFQEARDRSGEARASGGEVSAKAPNNRDAALHKALEIIQHLLTRS